MEKYTKSFADDIVQLCISQYESLRKTGKPKNEGEWTLLSCFVQEEQRDNSLKVVALGTGSKCIGSQQLPCGGGVLHDSHAEVIARRAFVLYLIDQVRKAAEGHNSIFERRDGAYDLKSDISFHFYTSNTPCGDASIFLKQEWPECVGNALETEVRQTPFTSTSIPPDGNDLHDCFKVTMGSTDTEPPFKKRRHQKSVDFDEQSHMQDTISTHIGEIHGMKMVSEDDFEKESSCTTTDENRKCSGEKANVKVISSDTFRTGAKCVVGEAPDPRLPGSNYHVTGVLRTKPGRGDPTLSLSCSDKIFRWTVLGAQGALLMLLLTKPVYVETIVIGQCPYSQEAMKRAIHARFRDSLQDINLPEGFSVHTPVLLQSNIDFPHSRISVTKTASRDSKLMPTSTSIIWSDTSVHKESQEVATNGRRLGCTKKNIGTPKSWVSICRKAISCLMLDLLKDTGWKQADLDHVSYSDLKYYSESYIQAWNILKAKCLTNWTVKPKNLQDFKVI